MVLDSNANSYFERSTQYLGDSEVKLIKSKDIFLTAQPGGTPIKKRKMCRGNAGMVLEILRPQSISSNTQYMTPSLKSFDELNE
jgi:hypothetical protein